MSLMNGLSAAGGGLATYAANAGAEAQKADVAKQLQQGQQTFIGGENEKTRQQQVLMEQGRQGFETGLVSQRAALEQQQAILADRLATARESAGRVQAAELQRDAPTEAQKNILFYQKMGWIPGGASGDSSAAAQPPASGGTAASAAPSQTAGNSGAVDGGTWDGSAPASDAATAPSPKGAAPGSATDNPLIRSALGLPKLGSEEDVRAAILQGIKTDPATKDMPADQQAVLLENRLAVGGAKIGSKESLDSIAQQIASYDLSPLDARARMTAGGPEVMAKVKELNPKYNEANYAAVVEAKKAITPGGSLFVPISAMETSLGHASHFLDIANQLGNYGGGNWANVFPNKIASNVGAAPLVNALTQTAFAMAEEGNRIYAGNAGTESAINNWVKTFPVNGSLADQAAAVKNFAQLMGDKFDTMAYHLDKTFKDSGIPPVELLSPKGTATYQRLTSMGPDGKPPQSASTPAATTTTPKPPAVGEVQQGYTFTGGNPADPNSWKAVK